MDKEKQKIYILIGIFAVIVLVIYYNLILRPQWLKFVAINRDFHEIKNRVKNAESLIASRDRIRMQYENLIKSASYLEKRFPGQDQISNLLEDFSRIADTSGVKILRIKPLETNEASVSLNKKDASFYSEYPILIEARAGYHEAGLFINNLENMERFIRIDDIDIKGRQDDPRHHDIKIRVSTYIAP